MTVTTWTAEKLAALFSAEHARVDAENREATAGPFSPGGEAYKSLCWHGTIDEAQDQKGWPADDECDPDDLEVFALERADTVVGIGRPVYVAFDDGHYPTVFCEQADEDRVLEAVASYFPQD